jgi:hypothetical protein
MDILLKGTLEIDTLSISLIYFLDYNYIIIAAILLISITLQPTGLTPVSWPSRPRACILPARFIAVSRTTHTPPARHTSSHQTATRCCCQRRFKTSSTTLSDLQNDFTTLLRR